MTSAANFLLFSLLLFSFVLPGKIQSQTIQHKKATIKALPKEIEFTIGNLKGSRLNVDSFKAQKMIKLTDDRFLFYGATVYFSGAGFENVNVATLSGNSLSSMASLINTCSAGSVIIFDNVKVSGPDGVRTIEGRSFALYGGSYDTVQAKQLSVNKELKELKELMSKGFISGTVYFSGANFPNVVIHHIKKDEPVTLFARCGPGSIISFENCIYKNADGTLSTPLTKTIKLN